MRPRPILSSGLGGTIGGGSVTIDDPGGYFEQTTLELMLQELAAKVVGYEAHGNMGATETFDAAIGWHSGTFDANCTFTLTANPAGTVSSLFLELLQDGTGGWVMTLPGSVVNAAELEAAQVTTADETTLLVLLSRDGGTTWYGGWWGGPTGLTVEDEGTPLATAGTTLDFVGAGVVASGTGAEKTITIAGVTEANVQAVGHYEVMMDGGSPPEPLESGSGTDWLYVWVTP
jgi:hypothetical protein